VKILSREPAERAGARSWFLSASHRSTRLPDEVAEGLQTMASARRQELARVLQLAVGKKRAKKVSLSSF